ncbi:hypothetical protein IP88_16680 [alpha proteobacterium AAP81b]|nr:hypothetical protein IP88_16680 [alpha proteobacterium AAP81b]
MFRAALAEQRAGRFDAALAGYDRVLKLAPRHADAHSNRGIVLAQLGRADSAIAAFDKALKARPDHADAEVNRAIVLTRLGRDDAAVAGYERALRANPRHLTAAINLGLLLLKLHRLSAAIDVLEHARAIDPNLAAVHFAQGSALREMSRFEPAAIAFRRAIACQPDHADAIGALALVELELKQHEAALAAIERLLALDPDRPYALELRQRILRELGDWSRDGEHNAAIAARLRTGKGGVEPLLLMTTIDDPELQREAARAWFAGHGLATAAPLLPRHPAGQRLRLGYFSADFHDHATMRLMAEMFEAHDRTRFEITAFSYGADADDASRKRLAAAVDALVDIAGMNDTSAIAETRRRRIDVAIDLKGLTASTRMGIFVGRAAPVQVSFLGYPGTLASPAFDWLIADRRLIPPAERAHYSEAIAWLPDSYQPNPRRRDVAARPTRAAAGLPEDAIVLCSFNAAHKVSGEMLGAWLRILGAVPDSVLWLWHDQPRAQAGLRAAAVAAGVAPERLIFAGYLPQAEHLARLGLADLFLDSFPYGAHTTASDALSQGVPLVTRAGRSFASRVPTSLLHAAGLPELSTTSLADYEALAVALASDPPRLAALKARVAAAAVAAPLFDPVRFARHLESAVTTMDAGARAGAAPADFDVAPVATPLALPPMDTPPP